MDIENLKKAAEAATPGPWECSDKHDGRFWHIHGGNQAIGSTHAASKQSNYANMFEANARFIAAANPAVVLALIAENERLKEFLVCPNCQAQGEVWTGRNTWEGHFQPPEPIMERCPECDGEGYAVDYDRLQLKHFDFDAEWTGLRKDAERYRWLRHRIIGASSDWDDSGKGMLGLAFKVPGDQWIGCDENIDAAMSKEPNPNEA